MWTCSYMAMVTECALETMGWMSKSSQAHVIKVWSLLGVARSWGITRGNGSLGAPEAISCTGPFLFLHPDVMGGKQLCLTVPLYHVDLPPHSPRSSEVSNHRLKSMKLSKDKSFLIQTFSQQWWMWLPHKKVTEKEVYELWPTKKLGEATLTDLTPHSCPDHWSHLYIKSKSLSLETST